MADNKLLTMYGVDAAIDVGTSDTPDWAELADGWDNLAEALNEVVQQYQFLSGKGFGVNHVTGMAPAYTLTGRRIVGDKAQDYIFARKYKLGKDRQTSLRLRQTQADGKIKVITCPATMCNITELSGAATDDSAISVELRFDGAPTVTEETATPEG